MRKKLGAWMGGLAVAAAVSLPGPAPSSVPPVEVTIALPAAAADFDAGLDVRDASGRVVADEAARRELRQLFVGGLYALLLRPELPRVAEALAVLEKAWTAYAGVLRDVAAAAWTAFLHIWLPDTRRFDPRLLFLAVAALLAVFCASRAPPLSVSPRIASHLARLSSVALRC